MVVRLFTRNLRGNPKCAYTCVACTLLKDKKSNEINSNGITFFSASLLSIIVISLSSFMSSAITLNT